MFASFVLPFQITIVAFIVALAIGSLFVKRKRFVVYSFLASIVLFVPSCVGVMAVVDAIRYGRFEYADTSTLNGDRYVFLPSQATNIVVDRYRSGHVARFSITTDDLLDWIEELRARNESLNPKPDTVDTPRNTEGPASEREFHVALSRRGGSITVWNVPGSGVANLRATYW